MAWFLVGLTVFAIFMGSLTAFLTVTVVKMNSNRGTYNMAKEDQPIKVFSVCSLINLLFYLHFFDTPRKKEKIDIIFLYLNKRE